MKRMFIMTLAFMLVLSTTLVAFAESKPNISEEEVAVVNLLNEKYDIVDVTSEDPEDESLEDLKNNIAAEKSLLVQKGDKYGSLLNDQEVEIDKDNPNTINISFDYMDNDEEHPLSIELPQNAKTSSIIDNVVITEDKSEDYYVTTEVFDGGIRNCFVVNNEDAPESYKVKISAENDNFVLKKEDDFVIVESSDGDVLASIAPPWAKDNNGNDLETYYEVDDNELTQVVKHKGLGYDYPIVADPTIGNWFKNYKWKYSDKYKGWTLRVYPTSYLISMIRSTYNQTARTASWNALKNKCSGSSHWKNAGGLKDQYLCHLTYALTKEYYGLDVWRPNVSYPATVAASCNP